MARELSGERIERILLHNICNEMIIKDFINPPWYSGQCFCLSRWRPGFNSPARQIFKLTFFLLLLLLLLQSPNPQIISLERASERKRMSTVEGFIWVNLYSLDVSPYFPWKANEINQDPCYVKIFLTLLSISQVFTNVNEPDKMNI